jgi:hypothetical protein
VNVAELMDILRDFDPETIVEMAIVAPVTADADHEHRRSIRGRRRHAARPR